MTAIARSLLCILASLSCDAFTPITSGPIRASTALAAEDALEAIKSRREMLATSVCGALALSPLAANALDFESFENSQIEADVKNCDPKRDPKCVPKLSADEALCQFGQQGGRDRTEACKRVRAAGGKVVSQPQGKSLGGAYAM